MAPRLTEEERERRRLIKAAAALERVPRGVTLVSDAEERRLYDLNRRGIDAPIVVWIAPARITGLDEAAPA